MIDGAQVEISKSAKRRAAKKARDAAHEDEKPPAPVPEPPAPAAKSKAKAKATAKTAAKPKEEAKPKTPEPKAQAKGKAKAKAEAKVPEPKAQPKAQAEPKAQPKAKAKAKVKAKKEEPQEEVAAPRKASADLAENYVIDDGSGAAWETTTGKSKKEQRRKDRQAAEIAAEKGYAGRTIPGAQQHIPGMDAVQARDSAAISQSVAASAAQIAKNAALKANEEAEADRTASSVTIQVPEAKVGILVGPKGATIKMIQEKSEARINIEGLLCVISGQPDAVSLAESAVRDLVEKGYTSLAFEDFQENSVQVHPTVFPDLIGKQGIIIRKLKDELKVEVSIPPTQPNAPANKKYKVSIAGKAANVELAKTVINDIVMYGHHDITHPGLSHVEMEVPDWNYRFLIGKAGSEMKHIQNNFKVRVNIPREHSANRQVVVVGDVLDVERAHTYIEKLLFNAENQTSGRGRTDGAVDTWGEEGEEEDWMGAYMYKRR